jgi:putative spermidine/putrescine transport system substrate-binding protein
LTITGNAQINTWRWEIVRIIGSFVVFVSFFALVLGATPVNSETFNVEANFDLAALTTENFYETLEPLAKEQGSIVFYDFTESFTPLFQDNIIPRFEEKYGIEVEYFSVDGEQSVQQLMAAKQAGQASPVDVFFMPNGQAQVATEAGIIANLPLNTLLPSAPDLDEQAATVSRGYAHGGTVVPFHRNQTAIGYDTRTVSEADAPKTFGDFLAYAKANPKKVAMTSPAQGGSGSGFLESAILHFASADCQERLYDATLSAEEAEEWASSSCLEPVMAYFSELAPNVEITNGNTDTLTLIANGVASIGTVWEDQAYDYIGRGLLPPTVKFRLFESGQVGDGDGVMIPSGTQKLAAALLFVDFMLSDEVQLLKLELNGSRSARTGLNLESALKPEVLAKLVPTDQYPALNRPRINNLISTAAVDRFVAEILQQ